MRTARILFGIVVCLLLALLGLVGYVLVRDDVQSDSLRRSVAPRVLIFDRTTGVTLTKLTRPAVSCPAARRASKIALVIDHSGSMADSNALAEAQNAAAAFINTVDLDAARIAILYFNQATALSLPFSQDQDALLAAAAEPILADGDTDIARALDEAGALLRTETTTNAAPIILILTDGGSDPSSARGVAERLRDEGVRIIAVSLLTADTNPDLLQSMVSTPNDYHESASPAELAGLYTDVATEINQAIAFDVTLVEAAGDALTVQPDTIQPAGLVAGNIITWTAPSLPAGEVAFTYRADVSGFGLRPINQTETIMNYTDCIAGAVATTLPPGPNVLILPPWLLALLGLLAALPFLLAWFKRPKPVTSPAAPVLVTAPEEPQPDRFPAWLRRLNDSRQTLALGAPDPAATPDDLTPTMIIGLGPVGRIVLSQVAQALRARHGGRLPDEVRLMQIDVRPKGVGGTPPNKPDYLEPDEWVVLEPNLDEIAGNIQRNPQKWPHLTWYEPTSGEDYGRAAGRMALFYDLKDGADRSIVWRGLSRLAAQLNGPKLRLIGSTFDDVGGGLLVDMAWLMQQNKGSGVDVELWLTGPINDDWPARVNQPHRAIGRDEQRARTLATLRELERFERNQSAPFHYVAEDHVQSQFRRVSDAAVVQTLYLFVPPDEQTSVDDHLATMADALLATLYTSTQSKVAAGMNRTKEKANILVNEQGQGMASGLGAFSVRLPIGWLDETLTWRVVYELLFESHISLHPMINLTSTGSYQKFDPDDIPDDAVTRRESAEAFVARFRRRYSDDDFTYALVRLTNDRLNGEEGGGTPALHRVGSLVATRRWLQAVRGLLNQEVADRAVEQVRNLELQIEAWEVFMEKELYPWVERRHRQAREQLLQLARQTGRQWAIEPDLEWPFYRQHVRDWLEKPTTAEDPLLRGARRFGWFVRFDPVGSRLSLELWAPLGDLIWSDDAGHDTTDFPLPSEPETVAARFYHLLAPLATTRSAWAQTLEMANRVLPQTWLNRAAPRLPLNETQASRDMGIAGAIGEQVILVAPRSEEAGQLKTRLLNESAGKQAVDLVETNDFSAVTVLRVRDRAPLHTCNGLYDDAAWSQQFVSPGYYIRRGEQLAAAQEGERRLSPRFVGWLEQDELLVSRYVRAYLFSLLDGPDNQGELELPGLGTWPGRTPGEGLQNLFSDDPNRQPLGFIRPERRAEMLNELDRETTTAQEEAWLQVGKREYLNRADQLLVKPWLNQDNTIDRDLAIYLQGIIRQL